MIQVYKKPINITSGENPGLYYYAAFSRKGTANTVNLAKTMSEGSSSFTKGEIVGVTIDLPVGIKNALLAGQAVTIDGLGTFKPSLTVREVKANPDELKISAISVRGINFTPDPSLITDINLQARFEWINADRAQDDGSGDVPGVDNSSDGNESEQQGDGGSQGGSAQNPRPGAVIVDPNDVME